MELYMKETGEMESKMVKGKCLIREAENKLEIGIEEL
jgi:hypothetical protein